jgi:hypothetical protein
MATTTTVSSNYNGKAAGAIIGQAFKEIDTIAKNIVTIAEDVNFKLSLRKIQYTNGTTAYSCGFTPAGAMVLNENTLEPKKFKNDLDVCKEDFRATWSDGIMGASASNPNAPADIMEAMQMEILGAMAEKLETDIWQGSDANADEFDGFITLWTADADIIKGGNGLTNPVAPVSESNVLDAYLKPALNAVPYALRRKELVVAVSPDVAQMYAFKLATAGVTNGLGNTDFALSIGRYAIEVVNGLPDNTVSVFERKNLVFGTGLLADYNTFTLVDEDSIGLLTGKVRGKVVYSAGVGYYNPSEIVWLTYVD